MEEINGNVTGIATIKLYDVIGKDKYGKGIDGAEIANLITEYEKKGYKKINVRINSEGGQVFDGMKIYSAIKNSSIPIDTYNDGLAGSIAGVIMLAGRNRIGADYSVFFLHSAYMDSDNLSESDKQALNKINESLKIIFNNNTDEGENIIDSMLKKETWLGADEAFKGGFYDEIYTTNRKVKLPENKKDVRKLFNIYNKIITMNKMENISKVLNLKDGDEETVINSIKDLKNSLTTVTSEKDEATKSVEDLKKQIEELNKKVEELNAEKVESEINTFLEASLVEGKIQEEEKLELFNLSKVNFVSVKNLVSKRLINKKSVKIENDKVMDVKNSKGAWTIRDWEKKDPKGLEEMHKNSPETYKDLYNSYYKK